MQDAIAIQLIETKYRLLLSLMDERMRRQWAAAEAGAYGWGGVAAVAHATGLSPTTIRKGQAELVLRPVQPGGRMAGRVRRPGAGRKPKTEEDPELVQALEKLVDPMTRGDPESSLRWTCKSTRTLAHELTGQGHVVSDSTVRRLLHAAGYSLQINCKTRAGTSHPDRNAQFEHINAVVGAFQERSQPVISVDTKKKELVGDFKHAGREWQPQGEPEEVRVHDFMDKKLGKAIP
jgi:transposase